MSGVLTLELLEAAVKKLIENSFKPDPPLIVPKNVLDDLIEYEKLEKQWKRLHKYLEKQMRLKHEIKCRRARRKHVKILPLPE